MSGAKQPPDLAIRWSKREISLLYVYQSNAGKALGRVLSNIIEGRTLGEMNGDDCGKECNRNGLKARFREGRPPDPSDKRTLAQELDARGYDLTTLRFSICKKTPAP